jgi:hypothetical protein
MRTFGRFGISRARTTNPQTKTIQTVRLRVATTDDQVGMEITFVGGVTLFEASLTLVTSKV